MITICNMITDFFVNFTIFGVQEKFFKWHIRILRVNLHQSTIKVPNGQASIGKKMHKLALSLIAKSVQTRICPGDILRTFGGRLMDKLLESGGQGHLMDKIHGRPTDKF